MIKDHLNVCVLFPLNKNWFQLEGNIPDVIMGWMGFNRSPSDDEAAFLQLD